MEVLYFVVQSSAGKYVVQALWYKVVLGNVLRKLVGKRFCA